MDSTELRAMQAPIKERYKSDPKARLITLKAKARSTRRHRCKGGDGRALAGAGLNQETGAPASCARANMLLEGTGGLRRASREAWQRRSMPAESATSLRKAFDFRGTLESKRARRAVSPKSACDSTSTPTPQEKRASS